MRNLRGVVAAAWLASVPSLASAQDVPPTPSPSPTATPAADDLSNLSLEQLLSIDLTVTSVSKREEDLNDAAAAIYPVTGEEIRRVGATSIPEALRVVPGLQVAQFNSSAWAISARGFNGQFNNKMLVLMDGRTLYTPLFGGVFWDAQDTVLADVDRIEVIRGPGGTLWGANAINGVINVITRDSADTQGLYASGGAGTWDKAFGEVRYGGAAGDAIHWRVFGKAFERDRGVDDGGRPVHDAWSSGRGGFRADWKSGRSKALFELEGYGNQEDQVFLRDVATNPPSKEEVDSITHAAGADALARFDTPLGDRSTLSVLGYWDRAHRRDIRGWEEQSSFDGEVQDSIVTGRNALVVGAGARSVVSDWKESEVVDMRPRVKTDVFLDAFAQDELRLAGDRLRLTAGSKFEQNDVTGFEIQPTFRALAKPAANQAVWAAISRAVRTPDLIERDSTVHYGIFPGPIYILVRGNDSLKSEEVVSLEGGWRLQVPARASFDLATFYNRYRDLIAVNQNNAGAPFDGGDGKIYVAIPFTNERGGHNYGAELSARWVVTPQWTMVGSYAFFETVLAAVNDATARPAPRNQASLRWYINVSDAIEATMAAYYSDSVGAAPFTATAFTRLDVGVTARPARRLEVALWGQNLLQDHHSEIQYNFFFTPSEVSRAFHVRVSTRF